LLDNAADCVSPGRCSPALCTSNVIALHDNWESLAVLPSGRYNNPSRDRLKSYNDSTEVSHLRPCIGLTEVSNEDRIPKRLIRIRPTTSEPDGFHHKTMILSAPSTVRKRCDSRYYTWPPVGFGGRLCLPVGVVPPGGSRTFLGGVVRLLGVCTSRRVLYSPRADEVVIL